MSAVAGGHARRVAAVAVLTFAALGASVAVSCSSGGAKQKPKPAARPTPSPTAARPALRPGDAQYRFEILRARDTSFTFLVHAAEWIRPGQRGIVVDPRRRDALVARFSTVSRVGDSVTAVITGQTMDVSPDHMVLLARPSVGTFRQRSFWLGLLAGALAGGATGASIR